MTRLTAVALVFTLAGGFAFAAEGRWTMVRSQSLTVIGDQPTAALQKIAVELEQFRAVLAGLAQNPQPSMPAPTTVYIFGAKKSLEPFLPLRDGRPAALGGYFQRDADVNSIALSLEGYEDAVRLVYHEYTHLLVHNAVRWAPVWVHEGLAEFYSTYALRTDGKTADIGRPVERHVRLLREHFVPLDDLIAVSSSSELYDETQRRSIMYAEAWALTHYLMMEVPDGPARLNRYVAAAATGKAPGDAFQEAFGATPSAFEKALRKYVGQGLFHSRVFTFRERIDTAAPSEGRTISRGEAEAWLGDLQRRVGRKQEAAPRIEAAVAVDPLAAPAHLALGLLRLSQERTAEAVTSLERAAALAPRDFLTQYLYGVTLLRATLAAGDEADDLRSRARAALTTSTALNAASADAFAWLAYAEMQSRNTVDAAAASIVRAIALAPGRLDYRLRYADIAMLRGAVDLARQVLTELAAVTGDAPTAEGAKRRLAALEAAIKPRAVQEGIAVETPDRVRRPDVPPAEPPQLRLRTVRAGEERAYGELTRVECGADVRFHLKVGERTIVATARRMEVDLVAFMNEKELPLACGAQSSPTRVFLTWRMAKPTPGAGGVVIVGAAVAVEFLPAAYVP